MTGSQELGPHGSDGERGAHHQVVVRVLEQEHLPDAVGIGQLRPREHEAEACAEERGDEPRHPSPSSTNAAPIAVAMNTAVATKLALEPRAVPQIPWPDVHPPALRVPTPMRMPPPRSAAAVTAEPCSASQP